MAAKIGILGESTAVASDTTVTLYTVPSSKAARVQIQIAAETINAPAYVVQIGSPGSQNTMNAAPASGVDIWTGQDRLITPDPALAINSPNGINQLSGALTDFELGNGQGQNYIISPLANSYFLSTGDTVKFRISAENLDKGLIQVVGVEDDA